MSEKPKSTKVKYEVEQLTECQLRTLIKKLLSEMEKEKKEKAEALKKQREQEELENWNKELCNYEPMRGDIEDLKESLSVFRETEFIIPDFLLQSLKAQGKYDTVQDKLKEFLDSHDHNINEFLKSLFPIVREGCHTVDHKRKLHRMKQRLQDTFQNYNAQD